MKLCPDARAPRQLALRLESPVLQGLSPPERAHATACLAHLLTEAAAPVEREDGDDTR